jgi:hypothetical protein
MHLRHHSAFSTALLFTAFTAVDSAQSLPTTQPGMVEIAIEDIKLGHNDDHETNEAAWAAAFEKAKHPAPYLALVSMTGRPQVWFTTAYESHAAIGNALKFTTDNKALDSEISRLTRLDAEHIEGVRIVQARARPDLSYGAFPDVATQRFWEITTFRLRPGFDGPFAAAAKAYAASASRNAPKTSFRTYEVLAGLPAPTFIVFGSVVAFADFDAVMKSGDASMKGLNAQEQDAMAKVGPGLISTETQRFRLSPKMSYVPADVRAKDPKFWATTQE